MKKQILLTISIAAVILASVCEIPSAFALQYTNYADPNGKWTIQYPSYWLAGNPKTNGSIANESVFTSGNGSALIIEVTANNPVKTLSNNGFQFNCDTIILAGHKTCVSTSQSDQNIDGTPMHVVFYVTSINGTNYLLQLMDTQTNFEKSFPTFMQMLTTFVPK